MEAWNTVFLCLLRIPRERGMSMKKGVMLLQLVEVHYNCSNWLKGVGLY